MSDLTPQRSLDLEDLDFNEVSDDEMQSLLDLSPNRTMSGSGGYSGWEGGNSWGTGEGGVLGGGKGGCKGKGGQVWGADRLRSQAMHYMSQAAQMGQMNSLANMETLDNIANCNW